MSAFHLVPELRSDQLQSQFFPRHTLRCMGLPLFKNQHARDVAALLDVDDNVVSWSCRTPVVSVGSIEFQADFVVEHVVGRSLVFAAHPHCSLDPLLVTEAARLDYGIVLFRPEDLPAARLQNAKDLLSNAPYRVTLDERLRLLCLLDEHGSATVRECLLALRAPSPMAALSSLYLKRFIDMDIDETLIGPETIVRRKRS